MGARQSPAAPREAAPSDDAAKANAEFWSEPSGTILARSLGIERLDPASLQRFDEAYFRYYPYLHGYVDPLPLGTSRVLEIGLGLGSMGQYLAGRSRTYLAIDIAAEPVRILEQRLAFAGLAGEVAEASALDLPVPSASVDIVVAIGSLHHTGNLRQALGEVSRVLVDGGTAVLMVYNRHSFRRLVHIARARLGNLIGRSEGSLAADETLRRTYDANLAGEAAPYTEFVSPGEVRSMLPGFRQVRVERRNFDDYYLLRGRIWLRRTWFLGWVDRILGLDLYIVATK